MDGTLALQIAPLASPVVGSAVAPLWALWGVRLLGVYGLLGVLFAVAFHVSGMRAVDPDTRGSSWGFRIVVTPGVIALWPLLAVAWRRDRPPLERNAHPDAADPS